MNILARDQQALLQSKIAVAKLSTMVSKAEVSRRTLFAETQLGMVLSLAQIRQVKVWLTGCAAMTALQTAKQMPQSDLLKVQFVKMSLSRVQLALSTITQVLMYMLSTETELTRKLLAPMIYLAANCQAILLMSLVEQQNSVWAVEKMSEELVHQLSEVGLWEEKEVTLVPRQLIRQLQLELASGVLASVNESPVYIVLRGFELQLCNAVWTSAAIKIPTMVYLLCRDNSSQFIYYWDNITLLRQMDLAVRGRPG